MHFPDLHFVKLEQYPGERRGILKIRPEKDKEDIMLLVPSYVAPSGIQGLGVFAGRKIKKGERIWTFDPRWDHFIEDSEFETLSEVQKKFLKVYAYHNHHHGPGFILESDNGRFMNHSTAPNLDFAQLDGFALRDIAKGEEMTCNYQQCCDEHEKKVVFRAKAPAGNGHAKVLV